MRRSEALQGMGMIKFLDVLGRYEAAEFNQLEAAELFWGSASGRFGAVASVLRMTAKRDYWTVVSVAQSAHGSIDRVLDRSGRPPSTASSDTANPLPIKRGRICHTSEPTTSP
jgi:hypothetical protein